jgi:hypothetical protein
VLRRVLGDLDTHPERGFLAGRVYRTGWTLIAVQYWESFDALDAWARDHHRPHRQPWQQYLREALENGAVGLWHETYLAGPRSWEGGLPEPAAVGPGRRGGGGRDAGDQGLGQGAPA